MKSITPRNEVSQRQKLGQILHNCFKARSHRITGASGDLIAEREPVNSALWQRLGTEVGVVCTWPDRFGEDLPPP